MAVVGIDLGTTNTVVACVRNGRVNVLPDEQGRRLLPSVVSFHPSGEVLVGYPAKERRIVDARNTIASVKRLIGRSWDSDEIRRAKQRFPFELKEGPGQGPLVVARGQEYTLPEISAFVLRRAKQIAERALGEVVDRAVITVPAHFNELQRAATKVAGKVAGLEVLRIINEPTAAALAYGLGRSTKERIAVYDFGGGTFDCTLLDLSGNVFEVLATAGDTFLGGDDVDAAIADRMAEAFLRSHRYDPRTDPQAIERLRISAEALKVDLSSHERASAKLREVAFGVGGAHLDLEFGMTRGELESLAAPLVERTFAVCQEALSIARLPVSGFDKVILVGGSTRIPVVRRRVEQFFGAPPLDRVNADEVVGIGAAIQAAALTEVARRRSIPPPPAPRRSLSSRPHLDPEIEREEETTLAVKVSSLIAEQERARASHVDRAEVPRTTARMGLPPAAPPTSPQLQPSPFRVARAPSHESVTAQAPVDTQPMAAQPDPAATMPIPVAYADVARAAEREAQARTQPLRAAAPVALAAPVAPQPPSPPQPPPPPPAQATTSPGAITVSTPQAFGLPIVDARDPRPRQPTIPLGTRPPSPPAPAVAPTPPPPPPLHAAAPSPYAPPTPPPPPRTAALSSRPAPLRPSSPPVLVDVTPRALVVETAGGWCDVVVPRNAKIPCERTRAYTTSSDMQTVVRVRVGQGEDPVFGQNTLLGEVELSALRAAPRGEVTIQLRFEVDESGTLNVSATDVGSGREAHASLQLVGIAGAPSIASMRARQAAMRMQ